MKEKKKYTFSLGVVLLAAALGLLVGTLVIHHVDETNPQKLMASQGDLRMQALMYIVDRYYVDEVTGIPSPPLPPVPCCHPWIPTALTSPQWKWTRNRS